MILLHWQLQVKRPLHSRLFSRWIWTVRNLSITAVVGLYSQWKKCSEILGFHTTKDKEKSNLINVAAKRAREAVCDSMQGRPLKNHNLRRAGICKIIHEISEVIQGILLRGSVLVFSAFFPTYFCIKTKNRASHGIIQTHLAALLTL